MRRRIIFLVLPLALAVVATSFSPIISASSHDAPKPNSTEEPDEPRLPLDPVLKDWGDLPGDIIPIYGPGGKPVKPEPKPNRKNEKRLQREKLQREIGEVRKPKMNRFQVKHTYVGENSFRQLSESQRSVRRYLVDINKKMFNEEILAPHRNMVNWLNKARQGRIKHSLVDLSLQRLEADFQGDPAFNEFVTRCKREGSEEFKLFTSRREYPVTTIIYHYNDASGGTLKVRLERFESQIIIGMKGPEINHYHGLVVDTRNENRRRKVIEVTSVFTLDELKTIAENTEDFWKELLKEDDLTRITYKGPLNDEAKRFKEVAQEERFTNLLNKVVTQPDVNIKGVPGACRFRGRLSRSKRAAEENCAFYLGEEGQVEAVDAEEFLKVYEEQGERGKRKMTDLVKENGDKISLAGEERLPPRLMEEWREKVNQKVVHQEVTTHSRAVEVVANMEDLKNWQGPLPEKAYKMLEEMEEKLSYGGVGKVRLSATKLAENLANHRYVKSFTEKVGKVSEPYGRLFLAGTLLSGIVHNDTTTLAIIGGRVGYDIVTETAVEAGTKFFTTATRAGKCAKFLGEVAGPIGGGILDVAIGGWLISKSVDRLKSAGDTYDRDDAIADIVSNSFDMVVGVGAIVLSIAFPPAAPFIMAAAFVFQVVNMMATSMFHAVNDVNKIDSEVPLNTWEKIDEGLQRFFDWFGFREKDYVDYLYETKMANDRMVGGMEEFLKNNSDRYMGVVFPSEQVSADNEQPELWKDSMVDFREMQTVWVDRDAPTKIGDDFEWKCRPGWEADQGEEKSVRDSSNEYLCKHAMSVEWKEEGKRGGGRRLLVKMDDGQDTVYLSGAEQTPSQFWMGDGGSKRFFGGGGINEFVFEGNCTEGLEGEVHGGAGDSDCVIIGPTCGAGSAFTVGLQGESGWITGGTVNFTLGNIEELVGRPKETENVTVGCNTKFVALGGGKGEGESDFVIIPKMECALKELQISVDNYTSVETTELNGNLTLVVPGMTTHLNVTLDRIANSTSGSKAVTVFSGMASSNVTLDTWERYQDNVTNKNFTLFALQYLGSNETVEFRLDGNGDQLFYFNETTNEVNSTMSVLTVNTRDPDVNVPLSFFHTLGAINGSATRNGCNNIANIFNVSGAGWNVNGGEKNDTFILYTVDGVNIQGGQQGVNTLVLRVPSNLVNVDLRKGPEGSAWVENVQQIVDGPETVMNLTCACDTMLASLQGGNDTDPDVVFVGYEKERCPQRNLQLQANGHSRVVVGGDVGRPWQHDRVFVLAGPNDQGTMRFEAEVKTELASRLFIQIHVNHIQWKLANGTVEDSTKAINVHFEGATPNEYFTLKLKESEKVPVIQLKLENSTDPAYPVIISRTPNNENMTATVLYSLSENHPKFTMTPVSVNQHYDDLVARQISGFAGIPNAFYLRNGSWVVRAGGRENHFVGRASSLVLSSLDGEPGEKNTLVLVPDEPDQNERNKVLIINLAEEAIAWQQGGGQEGWLASMHHVVGRKKQADHIYVDCDTKSVASGGGRQEDLQDVVWILKKHREKCGLVEPLEVHVEAFTKVVNNQTNDGVFSYFVEDVSTTQLELQASSNNSHRVNYQFLPWRVVRSLEFSQNASELVLGFKETNGRAANIHKFLLWRDTDGRYANPVVTFSPRNSSVWMELQVDDLGRLGTKYLLHSRPQNSDEQQIRGLPVYTNRFILNVTEGEVSKNIGQKSIVVRGSSRAEFNQFFLFNLPVDGPLYTLKGHSGGAGCSEKDSYSTCPINSVYLDPRFEKDNDLVINLALDRGHISRVDRQGNNEKKLLTLENIQLFHGRNDTTFFDTIYPACATQQVSGVENIRIAMDAEEDDPCTYNLTISLDHQLTEVTFFSRHHHHFENHTVANGTFNYYFTRPMSFQIIEEVPHLLRNTSHNFLLPFKLTDLESVSFDDVIGRFYYMLKGNTEKYWISMISDPSDGADGQFYSQPNMLTRDKFRLQVTRGGGSILFTRQGGPDRHSSLEMFRRYQEITKKTGATIIHQSEKELMHVGDGGYGDRNAVQNMKSHKSWLSGGDDPAAYFEIVALQKDVYIYAGSQKNGSHGQRQTLDLTDIVVPIRVLSGEKFVPKVEQIKNDLVIHMGSWQDRYSGRIFIKEGVQPEIWQNLQVVLSNSMMIFRKAVKDPYKPHPEVQWDLVPSTVELSREAVYSIAAQDLENNQTVHVLEYSDPRFQDHFNNIRFNISKNGTSLQLSDLQQFKGYRYDLTAPAKQVSMTTVIITDFYKKDGKPKDYYRHNHRKDPKTDENGEPWTLPWEVKNVTLVMPGLVVRLNEGMVTVLERPGIVQGALQGHSESKITPHHLNVGKELRKNELVTWNQVVENTLKQSL